MTEQQSIYQEVSALLIKLFEIDPQDITPEARLYEDLELDSIDAVDIRITSYNVCYTKLLRNMNFVWANPSYD